MNQKSINKAQKNSSAKKNETLDNINISIRDKICMYILLEFLWRKGKHWANIKFYKH